MLCYGRRFGSSLCVSGTAPLCADPLGAVVWFLALVHSSVGASLLSLLLRCLFVLCLATFLVLTALRLALLDLRSLFPAYVCRARVAPLRVVLVVLFHSAGSSCSLLFSSLVLAA